MLLLGLVSPLMLLLHTTVLSLHAALGYALLRQSQDMGLQIFVILVYPLIYSISLLLLSSYSARWSFN